MTPEQKQERDAVVACPFRLAREIEEERLQNWLIHQARMRIMYGYYGQCHCDHREGEG